VHALATSRVPTLESLARRIVPPWERLDEAGRARFLELIDEALMERPAGVRRQFSTFLLAIRWAPALRWGCRFDRLEAARQDAFLRWLERNPLAKLRQGFWGLKTLLFMGYYGRHESHAEIGYAPSFDGNRHLHA
jgi:hypothetical protein